MNSSPTSNQFVCVLNKKVEVGRALNALGHMSVGLGSLFDDKEQLRFQDYIDKDNTVHPGISDNPFIVLKAKNSNQIRTLRNALLEKQIKFTDFTDTMIEGTFVEQHSRTQETAEEDLEYFGICFFMNSQESRELTKKFSLYI
jgi:Protein of unknown function (DUF2000)